MDELELLLRTVQSLVRKGVPLLRNDASVTKLLAVLDHRQPAHQGLLAEVVQHLEVEVPDPLMLTPRFIILACSEVM